MSVSGRLEWVHGRGAAGTAAAKGALQRVRVKNRELLLWALRGVRPYRWRNARDGQLLRPTHTCVSRVARPCPCLPGFPELLEQAGPVLVPSSPEPSLHLSFRVSRLLAETRYRSLRARAKNRFVSGVQT